MSEPSPTNSQGLAGESSRSQNGNPVVSVSAMGRRSALMSLAGLAAATGLVGNVKNVWGQDANGNDIFPRRFKIDRELWEPTADWINTDPLTLKEDLKGKFVLFDFWTFCCINCQHILPELEKLEEKYPKQLVVIGVHCAKFENEKRIANVRSAVLREEILHPVLNDPEHDVWNAVGVNSWPTTVLVDPEGYAVYLRSGEFKAKEYEAILDKAIPFYRKNKSLNETPLTFKPQAVNAESSPLWFPGKVVADAERKELYIADTNHNRIVIADLEGKVIDTIGTGARGLTDGDYTTAEFHHPNGMARHGDWLYVADTENHALRKINLKEKTVVTVCGDGTQAASGFPGMKARGGGGPGKYVADPKKTKMASPWDLWVHGDALYLAMAGPHLIWKMPFDEKTIAHYAGNGAEDIVDGKLNPPNGAYSRGGAAFAQPSGLTSDDKWLYVADSEGSSVRMVPFDPKKEVETLVGTADLPSGRLFHFGDDDGKASKATFQHCLGVAYNEGKVYVADTYNNKIRVIDVKSKQTTTLTGTGKEGSSDDPAEFDHPGGISIAGGKIYLADTNNHAIRVVNIEDGATTTLTIEGLAPPPKSSSRKTQTNKDKSGKGDDEEEGE
jgi:DNA-binding beta-propeller fold protein YncE